jgi:hypothetical protein
MSRKPVTEDPLEQIKAAQSGTSLHGRSALYKWMWEHFDQLQGGRRGRPDWVAATKHYAQLGLKDTSGEPLKPRNVRRVWERVLRDRLATGKSAPSASSMPPIRPAPPPLPSPTFAAEPVAFEFRTLRRTPIRKQE